MVQNAVKRLREFYSEQMFLPSGWGIVFNPFFIIRKALFKSIKQEAPQVTGMVLDFGCGSKPYEELFKQCDRYIGVDIKKSGHNHQNSKIDLFYDGKKVPVDDESFDSIVCFEVVEHVFNPVEIFEEFHRVLKPGGRILMTVPFAWGEHETPYDFARYTSFGIHHLFEKNGFKVLTLSKSSSYIEALGQLFISYFLESFQPKQRLLALAFQVFLIFPLTAVVLVLNILLPKKSGYFLNNVALAAKV